MRRFYDRGLDVLGAAAVANPASDYGDEYGPLSPDQLAQLDRKLTPAEQAAVDAWQGKEADVQLATQRAKGGPQSATVSVTPQGAVIKSLAPKVTVTETSGLKWWHILLGALGAGAIGVGVYKAVRR